jgi:hypothetical protein
LGWRRFLLCGVGAFQVQRKNQPMWPVT